MATELFLFAVAIFGCVVGLKTARPFLAIAQSSALFLFPFMVLGVTLGIFGLAIAETNIVWRMAYLAIGGHATGTLFCYITDLYYAKNDAPHEDD